MTPHLAIVVCDGNVDCRIVFRRHDKTQCDVILTDCPKDASNDGDISRRRQADYHP